MLPLLICAPTGAYQLRPMSVGSRTRHASPFMAEEHAKVIFLRHGQSVWNEASLFTGWADVELTTLGKNEAAAGATSMWREGITVDVAYTSLLKRAQQTLEIVRRPCSATATIDHALHPSSCPIHAVWVSAQRLGWLTDPYLTASRFAGA